MGARISIQVKDESLWSKFSGLTWFIRIFQKSKVIALIDYKQHELKARSEPYVFDVDAGLHNIQFADPHAKGKRMENIVTGIIVGAITGAGVGGSTLLGASVGSAVGEAVGRNGTAADMYRIDEGETLSLVCKANSKGNVKVMRR